MPAEKTAASRRTGRPRATGRAAPGDVTDEVLAAASRLIGQLGVDGTTMSRIATEAGLRQPSLYYYFRSKEQLVAALVERANVVPLQLARALLTSDATPAVQLHRFVHDDVMALCALPFDINEVHRIASRDPSQFAGYWQERAQLQRLLAKIIRGGIRSELFRAVDPKLTALTVLGTDEGVQNWFRVEPRRRPDVVGLAIADLVVGGLLSSSASLPAVRVEAGALDLPPFADFR